MPQALQNLIDQYITEVRKIYGLFLYVLLVFVATYIGGSSPIILVKSKLSYVSDLCESPPGPQDGMPKTSVTGMIQPRLILGVCARL